MKNKIITLLIFTLIFSLFTINVNAQSITRGYKTIKLDNNNSTIMDGRLFININELQKILDKDIQITLNNNEIRIFKEETNASQKNKNTTLNNLNGKFEVVMHLNNKNITLNTLYEKTIFGYYSKISSIQTTMDTFPIKINNEIFIPFRYLVYSLGYKIDVKEDTYICKYIGIQDSSFGII